MLFFLLNFAMINSYGAYHIVLGEEIFYMAKTNSSQKKNVKSTKTKNSTKKTPAKSTKKVATANKGANTKSVKKPVVKNVESANVNEVKVEKIKTEVKTKASKSTNGGFINKTKNSIQKNWKERREFVIACIIIAILAVIIVLLALCKRIPKTKNGEEVLASVNGLTVTSDKLYQDLKNQYGSTNVINMIDEYIANDYVKKLTKDDEKYVDQVVDYYKQYAEYYGASFEDFLSQYVGIQGVTTEKEFRDYVTKDYKKTLAVKKYIGSTISEEELKKEYNENYKEKMTVRHILIEVNDQMSEEDAKKKAEDLINQLNEVKDDKEKLEKKFKDLAYDNSDDKGTYEDGGLFKDFSKSGVDEAFYKASKDLKNGEFTASPVKSQYGYHIILKVSSKTNKYKDVKEDIRKDLAEKKINEDSTLQVKSWDKLRKKYKLKINDTDVENAYKKTVKDGSKKEEKTEETKNTKSEESTEKTESTDNAEKTSSEE